MRRTLRSVALAAALASSPAVAQSPSPPDASVAPQIEQLIAQYVEAFNRRDAAALAAFFTEDAVFVGATGNPVEGRAAIEKFWAKIFAQGADVVEESRASEIHALGDNAWGIGQYTATFNGKNAPPETKGHWAAIYVRVDGAWKVRLLSGGPNVLPPQTPAPPGAAKK